MGVEPTSSVWKTDIIADILHLRIAVLFNTASSYLLRYHLAQKRNASSLLSCAKLYPCF